MTTAPKLGARVRALRRRHGLNQVQFADKLGVSASYVNLIEHNHRPVTASLLIKLARTFGVDVAAFSQDDDARLERDLLEVFSEPLFEEHGLLRADVADFVAAAPQVARAVRALGQAYRGAREERAELSGGPEDGMLELLGSGRLPSEEVSDLVQAHLNHFPALEAAAEDLWVRARLDRDDLQAGLVRFLREELTVDVRITRMGEDPGAVRRYDAARRELTLSELLPPRTRNFQLAQQVALLICEGQIEEVLDRSTLSTHDSRQLGRVALANYFAAAVLMPYQPFLEAAQRHRYDIELLGHRFRTSFEQTCHRMTSLRRPGQEGLPLHMVRVDVAGNLSKKFSATGIRFARFGAACSLWNVFQAFLTPGRFRRQLSTMPDGEHYFCVATTVPKGRGGFHAPHTMHAVGLGWNVRDLRPPSGSKRPGPVVYADGMDLGPDASAVRIGVSCRLCPRQDCAQRAFPQLGTPLGVDPWVKGVSAFTPVP
jgi:predicted transcriptional regulator/transcriptional regulator with XRE-family HTH domain